MKQKLHFILDVDGVLATGQFLYSPQGKVYKIFGAHDSDGLALIKDQVGILFISADHRGFSISKQRVADMGHKIKLVSHHERYDFIKKQFGLDRVIFMGDGIFDVPLLKECKFGIAPAGGRIEARRAADYVTPSRAGEGAVCDACLEIKKRFLKKHAAQ